MLGMRCGTSAASKKIVAKVAFHVGFRHRLKNPSCRCCCCSFSPTAKDLFQACPLPCQLHNSPAAK